MFEHLNDKQIQKMIAIGPTKKATDKEKALARGRMQYAIKSGLLPSLICSICGFKSERLHRHHVDYCKPLEVIFLCAKCHSDIHIYFDGPKQHPKQIKIIDEQSNHQVTFDDWIE
jgi:hypothetical protein